MKAREMILDMLRGGDGNILPWVEVVPVEATGLRPAGFGYVLHLPAMGGTSTALHVEMNNERTCRQLYDILSEGYGMTEEEAGRHWEEATKGIAPIRP